MPFHTPASRAGTARKRAIPARARIPAAAAARAPARAPARAATRAPAARRGPRLTAPVTPRRRVR